ncbi:hypothetical protein HJG60_011814 [Phyllostomus discolor]|uniref:Uncharacterized protein n=1 Tax=Phyllostomus discolor TaxID=89673 RepID=A0A833ZJ02_9CHIR|nr:hypothetical protein HJG60_011814 [Phyllostomus discolor]
MERSGQGLETRSGESLQEVCDGAEMSPVKTASDRSESASVFSGWTKTQQVETVLLLLNQPVITQARNPGNEQCPAPSAAAAPEGPWLQKWIKFFFLNLLQSKKKKEELTLRSISRAFFGTLKFCFSCQCSASLNGGDMFVGWRKPSSLRKARRQEVPNLWSGSETSPHPGVHRPSIMFTISLGWKHVIVFGTGWGRLGGIPVCVCVCVCVHVCV